MVSQKLKDDLHKNGEFFRKLYNAPNKHYRRKILTEATEKEIDTLISILHLIMTGVIPIKKALFESIKKSRRLPHLNRHLRTSESTNTLLDGSRQSKLAFLQNVAAYQEIIAYMLINREHAHMSELLSHYAIINYARLYCTTCSIAEVRNEFASQNFSTIS